MQIRSGTADDLDAIISFDHVANSDPGRVEFIRQALSSKLCLVVEEDHQVNAYAVLDYSFFGCGFVSMLYVATTARRRGIGRRLMNTMEANCKTTKLFTSTNETNIPMRALLESLGYIPSGTIYNLDPGDPEMVYFKDLSGQA